MSEITELQEPKETGHQMRDEIRSISERARARRQVRSRIMVVLCAIALLITAVPLVLLGQHSRTAGVVPVGSGNEITPDPSGQAAMGSLR